jgi:hypothetical protein
MARCKYVPIHFLNLPNTVCQLQIGLICKFKIAVRLVEN